MYLFHEIINWIVSVVNQLGYVWIFIWMFLESSFFPFPSEIIMIPAGYLAYQWKMNLFIAIVSWIAWSVTWAWLNYLLAFRFGRWFLEKFISKDKLDKLDNFFEKHGHISTFNGRLIPGVRQYISFPAWLAKMNWWKFTLWTALGAWIWICVLAFLGYFIGENQQLIHKYLKEITIVTLWIIVLISLLYYFYVRRKNVN